MRKQSNCRGTVEELNWRIDNPGDLVTLGGVLIQNNSTCDLEYLSEELFKEKKNQYEIRKKGEISIFLFFVRNGTRVGTRP